MDRKNTVIIIAGPTAVGKTSVALSLAQEFGTKIISADSRQCYQELNIGVARPDPQDLERVRHYFIASHSIFQKQNAVSFADYALEKLNEIFATNNVAVMVGGTGLYIKAFLEGMDEIPPVPDEIHAEVMKGYEYNGLTWLQEQVQEKDPRFYAQGEIKNPHRLMRALEVFYATGISILELRKGKKAERDFNVIKIALHLPKEDLHQQINTRVDRMIETGLIEEVDALLPYQHLSSLQTVGYRELFDHLKGHFSLTHAIELIKQHTRQYAKRQLTWFKKDPQYKWLPPDEKKVIATVTGLLD